MSDIKDFPTAVIASLSTGIMLCNNFAEMQQAAEFLMGHPIWTLHFADKGLCQEMQKTILEQCPGMPTKLEGVDKDNWHEHAARLEAEFGPTIKIRRGGGLTAMLPTDGIPDHLNDKTMVIQIPPKAD